MQGLGSLLLFAAFFYFMMRFGCGAHMVHGSHGGHDERRLPEAKDPVCGMPITSGEGYAMMRQGHQYRFCSKNCLDKFEREPERYLTGGDRPDGSMSGKGVAQ
jgi:YHS domain-containing protein